MPGAQIDVIDGMGHDLPAQLWPRFVAGIAAPRPRLRSGARLCPTSVAAVPTLGRMHRGERDIRPAAPRAGASDSDDTFALIGRSGRGRPRLSRCARNEPE